MVKKHQKTVLAKVKKLPHNPGVYLFYGQDGVVLYVGKAKSLINRVGQYFHKTLQDGKTRQLVENISDLSYIEVFSELESLILEAELIKKYRPRYNINLKDDKSYLYIVIRREGDYRKILTARKNDLLRKDTYFGPFPNATTAKQIVRTLRRIFPFRDCSEGKYSKYARLNSPCLYGHIGLCTAPCVGRVAKKTYEANVSSVISFLKGGHKRIADTITRKMHRLAKETKYEEAEGLKQMLNKIMYVQQSFRSPAEFLENPYLVDDIYDQAVAELEELIPIVKGAPKRIECFDVANMAGKDAAVSMVVAITGRIEKKEYKKFRIKLKESPNDVFMLKEALFRRLTHIPDWGRPDLIVVDGGKGQVGGALEILAQAHMVIPVIGLAKKEEVIVFHSSIGLGRYVELRLARNSEALKLLQRLRDESHRFARVYHHQLRTKGLSR